MINPSSLNLSALPWVPLRATSGVPGDPAIYFAIDSNGTVQYIGRSVNVRNRWKNHHRYEQLNQIGNVKIAYLFIDSPELLPEIEKALIQWFDPPLNVVGKFMHKNEDLRLEKKPKSNHLVVRRFVDVEVPNFGNRLQEARESSSKSLAELCRQVPMTPVNWYRIESNKTKVVPEATLRRIEAALGVDFGVNFDD